MGQLHRNGLRRLAALVIDPGNSGQMRVGAYPKQWKKIIVQIDNQIRVKEQIAFSLFRVDLKKEVVFLKWNEIVPKKPV